MREREEEGNCAWFFLCTCDYDDAVPGDFLSVYLPVNVSKLKVLQCVLDPACDVTQKAARGFVITSYVA